MPTEPVLAGRADATPRTSTLPMALDAAGRSLGTVCLDLLRQAAARGIQGELCPRATRGYFHAAKGGLRYVPNVHPAR